MAELQMTNAPGTAALVDDDDFGFLNQWQWRVNSEGYVIRSINLNGKEYVRRLHRIIADAPDGVMVDHINGNPLDNRRKNLRTVTPRQNCLNRSATRNKAHPYKGVYKNKCAATYTARINAGGKSRYLGSFSDPVDAARAYDEAAREFHGEYARLNFPTERAPGS